MTEATRPAGAGAGAELLPAMLLAAGYGTRLRPLGDRVAKPLLPVCGVPLLEIAARRLVAAGASILVVNAHHRADDVARFAETLALLAPVAILREPGILGTGGGIGNARAVLRAGPRFLLHNGDVLSDLDLRLLLAEHARTGAQATLALADWPEVNSVTIDAGGTVVAIGGPPEAPAGGRRLTYTGIAVFEGLFLDSIPEGPSSLVDALRRAMAADPQSVRGFAPEPLYWNDLGTVRRYLEAHRDLLERGRSPRLLAETARHGVPAAARFEGAPPAEQCVVLAGARVEPGVIHRRAVLGGGWVVTEEENDRARLVAAAAAVLDGKRSAVRITGHGSDRSFFRVREEELSAILMQTPPDDADFDRYVAVGRFLASEEFGGPVILRVDGARRAVLMEDLGDGLLQGFAAEALACGDTGSVRGAYLCALERLVDLQVRGTRLVDRGACPEAADRTFDHATLRWETDYFRTRFLRDVAGVPEADLAGLDEEFERLARAALEQPVVLMHRDYQSQNILLRDGAVRLVDFQGMRRGPLLYDVMSLLRDAYLDLGAALRSELLERYGELLAAAGGPAITRVDLRRMATVAGLQRNMQALGAFGFLSLVKGKTHYREFVPLALRHLRDGLEEVAADPHAPALPRLDAVARTVARERLPR